VHRKNETVGKKKNWSLENEGVKRTLMKIIEACLERFGAFMTSL
jgi:hypothetical protein